MRLYLVRHGEAVSEKADPKKPLSEKGREETSVMARFLSNHNIRVGEIWHSDKVRASQTAEIFSHSLSGAARHEFHSGLKPMDDVYPIILEIQKRESDLMIVSHLPFLGILSSSLMTDTSSKDMIIFRPSGVSCLERVGEHEWSLLWLVSPEIM